MYMYIYIIYICIYIYIDVYIYMYMCMCIIYIYTIRYCQPTTIGNPCVSHSDSHDWNGVMNNLPF